MSMSRRGFVAQVGFGLAASSLASCGGRTASSDSARTQTARSVNAAAAGSITIGDMVVNRLGFGAMRITGDGIWGPPKDPREARAVLQRAIELGVNFIDTADAYGPDVSETLIAETLYPYPRGLVIATKGGYVRPGPFLWVKDGRPEHLRSACEGSLRRLRLERIDLYQYHTPDPKVPIEDSVGELARLQQEGKIRHIGVSNFRLEQLKRARSVARIVSVQNRYNLEDRAYEEVLAHCAAEGLAFLPWNPLAVRRSRFFSLAKSPAEQVAAAHSVSTEQVAIAWLLAHSKAMLPIPGTAKQSHLEEDLAGAALHLSADDLRRLG